MALKNNWKDLVDGESFVEVEPINRMAHAIIANEESILSVQKLSESIQAENKSQEAEINELSKDLTRFEGDAVRLDSKINENKKRITNLEKGIPSDLFLTDSSIAYSKDVPQNALPYAEVRKIGGMTYKDGGMLRSAPVTEVESVGVNLFDPAPIGTKTFIGLTYTTEDGCVKINGTKVNGANVHIMTAPNMTLPAGTYTVSVRMVSGTVSGIEANGGVFFGINQSTYGQRTTPGVSKVGDVGVRTFTLSEPTIVSSFDIAPDYASAGAVFDNAVFACQFERANTVGNFKPYTHNTLPIPESVQALDGYGWGINDEVYNYIDFETKQFVKRVGKVVFDGSSDENWEVRQYTNLVAYLASEEFGKIPNIVLCDRFESFIDMSPQPNGTVGIAVEGLSATAHTFFFGVSGIATNVAEWRAYLAANPITVVYELATPVVTDISDLVSEDNFIGVEGNGTITMANQYKYNVPSEIAFMLDEV